MMDNLKSTRTDNLKDDALYVFVRTGPWWSKIPLGYWVRVK